MGQSRISMQLAQLKQAGLVEVRRAGQKSLYRIADIEDGNAILRELLRESRPRDRRSGAGRPRAAADPRKAQGQAPRLLRRARRQVRPPLRSRPKLEGLAEMLLKLMPPLVDRRSRRGRRNAVAAARAARRAGDRGR